MGLISEYVEVGLGGNNVKYYESLGYEIPRRKDKWGKVLVPKGAKITVKVKDLSKGSDAKVKIRCDNPDCNKEYEILYRNYLKCNHNGKTYCNACGNKIFLSGENNPRWNPNLSQEERENGRNCLEKTEFVKKVMTRDNYTCQCCNKPLNHDGIVHHLNGWDNFKEQRYDVQNGITLCETCHKNFHSKYGYGGNTRQQFEEWIGQAIGKLKKYDGELPTTRQIYCIEEDKIYDSVEQLANEWNLKSISNVYSVCKHEKHYKSIKGKHLLWLDEYEQCSKEDIQKYLEWCKPSKNRAKGKNKPNSKKVICVTTREIFDTITEASKFYNINKSSISDNCRKKQKSAGKLNDGTKLEWAYCENN